MELKKYFSIWWESRNDDPMLFYGVIIALIISALTIVLLLRSRKHRKKEIKNYQSATESKISSFINEEESVVDKQKAENTSEVISIGKLPQNFVIVEKIVKSETQTTKDSKLPSPTNTLNRTEESKPITVIPAPKIEIDNPEKEEQSKEKYIGYDPINVFAQTEPLSFPYVIMPKPNCVIKFPRKGRLRHWIKAARPKT